MTDKVICPLCGRSFKSLPSHIVKGHKISIEQLLNQFPDTVLVSESTKQKASETNKANGCGSWIKGRKASKEERERQSLRQMGEKNPFFGKKHTDETRQKMVENHADFTGDNNPYRNWLEIHPEDRVAASERAREFFVNLRADPISYSARSEKLSKSMARAHIDGKLFSYGRGHKNGHYQSLIFNRDFYYRSSYELFFIQYCEKSKSDGMIFDLCPCDFYIPYISDQNITKNYIPDFLLNKQYVIEIKPSKMKNVGLNALKIEAGINYCIINELIFIVLTELELDKLKNDECKISDFFKNK